VFTHNPFRPPVFPDRATAANTNDGLDDPAPIRCGSCCKSRMPSFYLAQHNHEKTVTKVPPPRRSFPHTARFHVPKKCLSVPSPHGLSASCNISLAYALNILDPHVMSMSRGRGSGGKGQVPTSNFPFGALTQNSTRSIHATETKKSSP
jgi:hypothetical protein